MDKINIFPWNHNFNTGLKTIDEQHHKLVDIINDLATRFSFNPDSIDLSTVFDELLSYTTYHFDTEESIWKSFFDEETLQQHQQTHKTFIDKVKALIDKQKGNSIEVSAENTLNFLVKWLVTHILESDRHLAYRVNAIENGYSLDESIDIATEQMNGHTREMIDIIIQIYDSLSHTTLRLMRELDKQHKIEETLTSRERLLDAVINEIPDVLVLKDQYGNFIMGNKTVADLYGTTPEAMVGKDDADFGVSKEMSDAFRENVLSIMRSGKTDTVYEDSQDAVTGETRHYKSIKKPFKDIKGNNQILVIAHDITEIVHSKNELQKQRTLLQTLFETIPYLICLKDPNGKYITCNPKFESFFDILERDIIDKTDHDFLDKELADIFYQQDQETRNNNKLMVYEDRIKNTDDTGYILLQTTKVPMYDDGHLIGILGISNNITEQRNQEERLNYAMLGSSDGLWDWDMGTNEIYYSPRWCEMVGYKFEELPGTLETFKNLVHPDDIKQAWNIIEQYINHQMDTLKIEFRMHHKDGHWVHILSRAQFVKEKDGTNRVPLRLVGTHVDVTERWKHQQELVHLAHYDNLTNLPNRLLFSDRLEQAIIYAKRHQTQIAVLYLDLDKFKEVNDTYGHDVGDKLLLEISNRLKQTLRTEDTLSRFGGDEFVAVVQDFKENLSLLQVLERLLVSTSTPVITGGLTLHVSASIGVTFYPQDDEVTPNQLIRQADQAMYRAKQLSKNRYHIFDSHQDRIMRDEHEGVEQIRDALKNNEFVMYYQPKVNISTGKILGAEALIRWNHPEKGILLPIDFLPKIEENTLIVELGDWVFETVLQQMEYWQNFDIKMSVSVNISAKQLGEKDFVSKLEALLKKHPKIHSSNLELEILETSALEKISYIVDVMAKCKNLGVNFSLDDFGTGYSSLTYLKRLPANVIKIDKSFISNLLYDTEDLAIVEGILELANTFKRQVIAEGVESIEQGMLLLLLGCKTAQGYVIAKPMPAEKFSNWSKKWKPPTEWIGCRKLPYDDISLLYAIVEHRKWVKLAISYISDDTSNVPQLNPEQCMFGQWLQHFDHDTLEYDEFIELHNNIHTHVKGLINQKARGNDDMGTSAIKELEELGDTFVKKIFQMIGDQYRRN